MATTYHVACGQDTGRIYAGTINKKGDKWTNKTDVTEEALAAVRDHLVMIWEAQEEKDATSFGYQWTKKDGTAVTLQVTFEQAPAGEKDEEKV